MDSHSHESDSPDSTDHKKGLLYALLVNTSFIFIEVIIFLVSDSLTVFADLLHMITDSASIALALLVAYVSQKDPDSMRTYGYGRLEVLSGLGNALFLLAVVGYILFDSIQRLSNPPETFQSELIILVGIIGVGINILAAYFLHGSRENINVEGAFQHLIADAVGSIATLLAGVLIYFTGLYVFDVLFALVISGIILYSIKDLLYKCLNILLLGRPVEINIQEIENSLEDIENVVEVHHTHIWSISSEQTVMSTHIVINDEIHLSTVLNEAHNKLEDEFDIHHSTIQIETDEFVGQGSHKYHKEHKDEN